MQSVLVKQALAPIVSSLNAQLNELWDGFFMTAWADNGDQLSKLYTGTGALKSDVTRSGARSAFGMLVDAKKSRKQFAEIRTTELTIDAS